jgi:hypothetical protein
MTNTKQENAEPKAAPVAKVRIGLITASIWENKTDKGTFHNVTFERRYKAGDQWKSTLRHGRPAGTRQGGGPRAYENPRCHGQG